MIKADLHIPIVSAASIYAKVTRDKFMEKLSLDFPKYGFASHVGYGTATHKSALTKHGIIKGVHRQSYKPVKLILEASV